MKMKLKDGRIVSVLPTYPDSPIRPPRGYVDVLIPYTARELLHSKMGRRAHVQRVALNNLSSVMTETAKSA